MLKLKYEDKFLNLDELDFNFNPDKEDMHKLNKLCIENNLDIELEICKYANNKCSYNSITININNIKIYGNCFYIANNTIEIYNY